jgi:hypothetical protein
MNVKALALIEKEGALLACTHVPYADDFILNATLALGGNLTLRDILAVAKLSKSTAYNYGIVPKYNDDGAPIEIGKVPPRPWLRLPEPIVKTGKKLWAASDIIVWLKAIRVRSCQAIESTPTTKVIGQKVGEAA